MAARFGNGIDHKQPNFLSQLRQLFIVEFSQIFGPFNRVKYRIRSQLLTFLFYGDRDEEPTSFSKKQTLRASFDFSKLLFPSLPKRKKNASYPEHINVYAE